MAKIPFRKREKAFTTITSRITQAVNYQRPLFQNFIDYYQIYRAVRNRFKQNYQGQANLMIPYVYANIENAYPKMIASKPRLNVLPREQGDVLRAEVMEKLLDYQWYNLRMKLTLKDWVKQGLIYGVSPLKVTWEFDPQKNRDDIKTEVLSIYDFYIDPDATSIQNARYVVQESWRNIEELRKNPNYDIPSRLKNTTRTYDEYETQVAAIKNLPKDIDSTNEKIKIWEYWGLYDIEGKGIEEECLIVIADAQFVIRLERNPYAHQKKPFVAFRDTLVPNQFWAMGEIEPTVSLQYELNDIRNQRMDNVTQILRNQPIVSRQSNVRTSDIKNWQNGGILYVDGAAAGSIDFARPPDVTASGYNEETLVKSDMQFVSSLTDVTPTVGARRVQSLAQRTATGATIQQEETNARFRAKLDNLEDALTELGSQMIALNQQFIDSERVIRITGENGQPELVSIRPSDIEGEFDMIAEAGATQAINKQLKKAEASNLVGVLTPFVQLGIVKPDWLAKYVLEQYDIQNTEDALNETPQQAAEVASEPTGETLTATPQAVGGLATT